VLHLTNGDCAAQALERAGIAPDDVLAWRDVLHEGPVPEGLALEELSAVRAGFLAEAGFASYETLRGEFYERDVRLAGSQAEDEVVCWFESDLYDQLQLLQVLDWYAEPSHRPARLTLIQLDLQPEGSFDALGGLAPEQVRARLATRLPVTAAQLETARQAWSAFRSPTPTRLETLWRQGELAALPCLPEAVHRLLEELPWVGTGLSRSQQAALQCLAERPMNGADLFRAVRAREARPFLGDAWFWRALEWLQSDPSPLIARQLSAVGGGMETAVLALTLRGQTLVRGEPSRPGEADCQIDRQVDRWWGGTRMTRRDTVWRWDGANRRVVAG